MPVPHLGIHTHLGPVHFCYQYSLLLLHYSTTISLSLITFIVHIVRSYQYQYYQPANRLYLSNAKLKKATMTDYLQSCTSYSYTKNLRKSNQPIRQDGE